jgi:hypothetical protein
MWAIVEIMGHRVRAGRCSDTQFGGATMLRIEHPTATTDDGEPVFELYSSAAIFAARPCTEMEAASAAAHAWYIRDATMTAIPAAIVDHIEDDDAGGTAHCPRCGDSLSVCECEPW